MCVERVHEYYGMAGGGVVRQGRGGGRVGGELCAHGGRGQREWTTHGCYGNMAVSVRVCVRACVCGGGGGGGVFFFFFFLVYVIGLNDPRPRLYKKES